MKKRVLLIIFLALLMISISACNDISNSNVEKEGGVPTTETTEKTEQTTNAEGQVVAEGSISCNGNDNSKITYKINQRGEVTLYIEDWNEDHLISAVSLSSNTEIEMFRYIEKAIAINNKHAYLFLQESDRKINVVRFEKGSTAEMVTSIEMSENVIEIKGTFINENIGYLFAFKEVSEGYANGGSKLSNLFITEDGGNTWNLIDLQNVSSISLREYIIYSKMISEDVGLISGNFFAADYNFCERTLLTTDGGLNWIHVADLPQVNELLWAVVTDFKQVGDSYVMTVRYTVSESTGEYGYAEYKLIDLNTWIRIS